MISRYMHIPNMTQLKRRLKTQHQITAVIINNDSNVSVNVSETKTDVFIATVLKCSH